MQVLTRHAWCYLSLGMSTLDSPDEPLQTLLSKAAGLPPVAPGHAAVYGAHLQQLAEFVDERIESDRTLSPALAGVPQDLCRLNHRNHARFMATVFALGAWEVMVRTVVWVYRSYRARGLPASYFPAVVNSFSEAVREILPASAAALEPAYALLRDHHEVFVRLSSQPAPQPERQPSEHRDRFLRALLRADTADAILTAKQVVADRASVAPFYLEVVEPAMAEVGRLWESGKISVAQEHVATAMAHRAMASLYAPYVLTTPNRGRAIVLCATGELHEMGARMVADLLELDGWEVCYVGADVPVSELPSLFEPPPFLAAISASMFFHVPRVLEIVALLRANPATAGVRIVVGGRAFVDQPELAERVGADERAVTAADAVLTAARWWAQRPDAS